MYTAGSSYNPAQLLRDDSVKASTGTLDKKLAHVADKEYEKFSIEEMAAVVELVRPDPAVSERVWDSSAIAESIRQFAKLYKHGDGYIYVDRGRELDANRRETAGILTGGEIRAVPTDKPVIYMLRTKEGRGRNAAWWPQVRFPDGRYAFAFAI